MTDKAGPSENVPAVPGSVTPTAAQDPPGAVLPPFVCVLPCTAPPVKYLDRLDGCASGLHVTREDTKDLQLSLYGPMADTIMAKEDQVFKGQVAKTVPYPCTVCKASVVPGPSFPLLYMENCVHYLHHDCVQNLLTWNSSFKSYQWACPHCQVVSSRVLLWPGLFASEAAKNDTFQLQKRSLGLDVAPQTALEVNRCYVEHSFPAFSLVVNSRSLTVRRRPPPEIISSWKNISEFNQREPAMPALSCCDCGSELRQKWMREEALALFRCPFDRLRLDGPNGGQCSGGKDCEFWHESPSQGSRKVKRTRQPAKGILRDFPRFFCVRNSRILKSGPDCRERLRASDTQEMVRCLAGFHPTLEDLENVDGFACKMAKQIIAPVVATELDCAFCHKAQPEPNSVRLHLQNCVHWLHVSCLAQARLAFSTNSNRTLDLHCPSCLVPSVRTLAWPGPFRSDQLKQTIFEFQLKHFKLTVLQADTQLAIVQVPNQVNVFTLDYGGPSVVTIDGATAQDDWTILYD